MDSNDNEKMNIQIALDELDISLDEIELTKLDQEYIKKQYHKLALKWHPDKNKDDYLDATIKFQKINEAYDFLSNELHIINGTNIDGTNAADVSISYYDGTNTRAIGSTISVPADAALNLIDKNSSFYLEENDIISGLASANSDLVCLISYEIIS